MKISVMANDGTECFSYDTGKDANCLCPGWREMPEVVSALLESATFLVGCIPVPKEPGPFADMQEGDVLNIVGKAPDLKVVEDRAETGQGPASQFHPVGR